MLNLSNIKIFDVSENYINFPKKILSFIVIAFAHKSKNNRAVVIDSNNLKNTIEGIQKMAKEYSIEIVVFIEKEGETAIIKEAK